MSGILVPALAGFLFVMVTARLISGKLQEVLFFGGVFALFDVYEFGMVRHMGVPAAPSWLFVMVWSAIGFWALMRLLWVLGQFWFPPLLLIPRMLIGE